MHSRSAVVSVMLRECSDDQRGIYGNCEAAKENSRRSSILGKGVFVVILRASIKVAGQFQSR